jgi:8-oxo-dGTP pyrophosphatase MutT (NUDIX family)
VPNEPEFANPEIVDYLDEKGALLGRVAKDDAHALGLLHRIVIGEARDEQGNVLLVRQATDRQEPGLLVSAVGGHLRSGESLEAALRREVMEEIGVTFEDFRYLGPVLFCRSRGPIVENHLYEVFEIQVVPADVVLGREATSFEIFTETLLRCQLRADPGRFGEAYWVVVRAFYRRYLQDW